MDNSYQLSLFSEQDSSSYSASSLRIGGLVPSLKACMQRALAATVPALSRDQLVDRMNAIAKQNGVKLTVGRGQVLTLAVLEKWLAVNDPYDVPPIPAFVVFMLAVGSFEPLCMLAELNGCKVITEAQNVFYEYGKEKFEAKYNAKRLKALENQLVTIHTGKR